MMHIQLRPSALRVIRQISRHPPIRNLLYPLVDLVGQESTSHAGDPGSIPEWGRSPGEGNGSPLQYSCLENPMDREAWWSTVPGVTKSQIRLSDSKKKKI